MNNEIVVADITAIIKAYLLKGDVSKSNRINSFINVFTIKEIEYTRTYFLSSCLINFELLNVNREFNMQPAATPKQKLEALAAIDGQPKCRSMKQIEISAKNAMHPTSKNLKKFLDKLSIIFCSDLQD